jgi:hypothetical protein
MVLCLASTLQQAKGLVSVPGSVSDYFEEVGGADVERARAGDEDSARSEHLKRAQIKFLVATAGLVEVPFGLGERGRIEYDGVVFMACLSPPSGIVA